MIKLKRKSGDIFLSHKEVNHIVNEWYTNGMFHDILQDDNGNDLEEILNVDYSIKIETVRDDE